MLKIHEKKSLDYLGDINEKKARAVWKVSLGVLLIVMISISILGFISFRMISASIQKNSMTSSIQLVKQTAQNIETILSDIDRLAVAITLDGKLNELVNNFNLSDNEHEKAEYSRHIREIMNIYAVNREDIADMAVVTDTMEYISSGELIIDYQGDVSSFNAVKLFRESGKDSLWVDTYIADAGSTYKSTGSFGQVITFVKKINAPESNESCGMLIINYKESYLYQLISDIKVPEGSEIYILGKNGNYVMNIYDRTLNGDYSQYDLYLRDGTTLNSGSINRTIDDEDYIFTFETIQQINETPLEWRVFLKTEAASVTKGIIDVGMKIFFLGLAGVTFGFIFSVFLIRRYNLLMDKKYNERHSILMEQERLASLGQLIGGIAHNFKTPIMSIADGLEAIKELALEYDRSIENENVKESDHHRIAAEMREWVKKIRPYCAYMSDIISAVKGQAVNCNESSVGSFAIKDLINRVQILMNHELKKNQCNMNIFNRVDEMTEIRGEINNLVQVMNNLISNAIEAYRGKPGNIDVIFEKTSKELEITVRDYGCGIPERVKNKLLKEMITTKSDKGTGIGLYISYSTIKGKFAGSMHIESEEGKGTLVKIIIPLTKK
ncbi:sensor histidine kinase [Acetivibrio clariflavus]|uniref:sensor histidine kinase n=1 Tax=Acetivibrio clariflavus TaxID=288965 RepID=UPI000485D519|nr:sensor histidine kinase [Acetivibrio clariflavus]